MTEFRVIGTIGPDEDHHAVHEALEEVNENLDGGYRVLSHYESGQGLNSEWFLVEEVDDDE